MIESSSSGVQDSWREHWDASVLPQVERAQNIVRQIIEFKEGSTDSRLPRFFDRDVLRAAHLALPGFATLNPSFMATVAQALQGLRAYSEDKTRRRPYNVMMMALPGSGKSYFAQCLGRSLGTEVVTGNLATPDLMATLHLAIEEVRNHKAVDVLPVLFLDEADSSPEHLSVLLPLLWDGEFVTGGQRLRMGRSIIVCAVSNDALVSYVRTGDEASFGELRSQGFGKAQDFLSRFDGGFIEIPSINDKSRAMDKVCIAVELMRRRFDGLRGVQATYLQFIAGSAFLNETRSLEFLINSIPSTAYQDHYLVVDGPTDQAIQANLDALDSGPMRYHLASQGEKSPLGLWMQCLTSADRANIVELDRSDVLYA